MRRALLIAVFLASACARGDPLTPTAIEAAHARWQSHGVDDYTIGIEIKGDRIQEGNFRVTVTAGGVVDVLRNDQTTSTRDPFYTIDGMFAFLRDELELAASPERFWGVPAGTHIHQRVLFHPRTGQPLRYVRAVSGTQHNITIHAEPLEAAR